MNKVKQTWLILNLVKIPHYAPAFFSFQQANTVRHHGNGSIHGFSALQVNEAVGMGIKGRKTGRKEKMEVKKIILHNTTEKIPQIPQDNGPGEQCEIETNASATHYCFRLR